MATQEMTAVRFVNMQASSLEDWGLEADETVEVTDEGLVSVTSRDIDQALEVPVYVRGQLRRLFFGE